jgi:hypothetical protein
MYEIKAMLESKGWKCALCGACGNRKVDCLNNQYKDYMITAATNGLAKIVMKGKVIANVAHINLAAEMRKLNIYSDEKTIA